MDPIIAQPDPAKCLKQDFFLHHLIKLYPKYDNKEPMFAVLREENNENSGELFVYFIKNIHL
jgi:hypothetical protein